MTLHARNIKDKVFVTDNRDPKVQIRTSLPPVIFVAAREFRNNAINAKKLKDRDAELIYSLFSILLAFTISEVFINEFAYDNLSEPNYRKVKRASIVNKWECVPRLVTKSRLDLKLLDAFKNIKDIRNKYIIHYKVFLSSPVTTPRGGESELHANLTATKAKKACSTVAKMIKSLLKLAGKELPSWIK